MGVEVQADPKPERNRFIRSDQYSFIREGIPALAFKFGYRKGSKEERLHKEWFAKRYHAPGDDLSQPVDREGAARFVSLLADLTSRVADAPERPSWNEDSFFRRFDGPGLRTPPRGRPPEPARGGTSGARRYRAARRGRPEQPGGVQQALVAQPRERLAHPV